MAEESYQFGVIPLAIPLVLHAMAKARQRQAERQGNQLPTATPGRAGPLFHVQIPPAQPPPSPGDSSEDTPMADDLLGALFGPRRNRELYPDTPRRVRVFQRPDGGVSAIDETGQAVEIMGMESPASMGGGEAFGADDAIGEEFGADFAADEEEFLTDDEDEFGADLGAEELGADEFGGIAERLSRKIANLKRRIAHWQMKKANARMPFKANKQRAAQNHITNLTAKLRKLTGAVASAKKKSQGHASTGRYAGGVGNVVTAVPPGAGRLQRFPFTTLGTSAGNPRNALTVPGGGITGATVLITENMPWYLWVLVGFTAQVTALNNGVVALVQNLTLGGNNNLFGHDGPEDATVYDTDVEHLIGLRDYVDIKSPNQARVNILGTGTSGDVVVVTCQAVGDVISDDSKSSSSRKRALAGPGSWAR